MFLPDEINRKDQIGTLRIKMQSCTLMKINITQTRKLYSTKRLKTPRKS